MKNAVPLTVLLFLTSALGFEQAVATTAQEDKHVEEEIRRLNAEEVNAFLHKDPTSDGPAMVRRFCCHKPAKQIRDQATGSGNGRVGLSCNDVF